MGLFKKKPGGTFLGNLIRVGVSKATSGVMGTGANMIPLGATEVDQAAVDAAQKLAIEKAKLLASDELGKSPTVKKMVAGAIWDKYKYFIIAFVVIIVGTIIILARRGNNNGYKKRY